MQVAFHVGVYGTDDERITRCLLANEGMLRRAKVELSPNAVNEPILNEALNALKGGTASGELEDVVLDALAEAEDTRRLIVSRPTLLGVPRRVFEGEGLLSGAHTRMRALANVLPQAEITFFMAIKNPATLVPDMLRRFRAPASMPNDIQPDTMRWAPTIRKIVAALGHRRLVIWCNEDTPLIFPEVVRRLAGLPSDAVLQDDNPVVEALLSEAGTALLARRLGQGAQIGVVERRQITAEVLAEHHLPEAITARIAKMPWDQTIIDRMTADYDADVAEIAALPGVEFMHP